MKKNLSTLILCSIIPLSAHAENWGTSTTASGDYSTAWGKESRATGDYSTVWGDGSGASGSKSTAWGEAASASGAISTAWGYNNSASGGLATAWGELNSASGGSSTAWGIETRAGGSNSTSFGRWTIANARNSVALGEYNVEFSSVNPNSSADSDPLFSIGNGTSTSNRSNALTVLRDGTTTFNGDVFVYGSIYELSDARLKSFVEPLYFSEDLVMDLNPVTYVMTDDPEQKNQIGFIAQEVEQVLPELVGESIDGYKTVDYAKITAVLVGAVQSLKKENMLLKEAICKKNTLEKICHQ